MATQAEVARESPGGILAQMLAGHRMFFENLYSLFRFLEGEITKNAWELVKNGGYGVTRNGMGRGLASFASGDWLTTQMGIAFVAAGSARLVQGTTNTKIPEGGLNLLFFQGRWLDKSPEEPVIWHGRLRVEAEGATAPRKWEEYQSIVFSRLEPEGQPDGARSGNTKPGRASISGAAVVFTGTYSEVPVASILSQEDVMSQLVDPALAER